MIRYECSGCALLLSLSVILIVVESIVNECTIALGTGVDSWKFCRNPKTRNNGLISRGRKKTVSKRRDMYEHVGHGT